MEDVQVKLSPGVVGGDGGIGDGAGVAAPKGHSSKDVLEQGVGLMQNLVGAVRSAINFSEIDIASLGLQIPGTTIPHFDLAAIAAMPEGLERKAAVAEVITAMRAVGFIAIRAPDVCARVNGVHTQMGSMFHQPRAQKEKYDHKNRGQTGWYDKEGAPGNDKPNNRECVFYTPNCLKADEDLKPDERSEWPEDCPEHGFNVGEYRPVITDYYKELVECGRSVLKVFFEGLGVAPEKSDEYIDKGVHRLRLAYYKEPVPGTEWASAHTDLNFLTILAAASLKGLELLRNGVWTEVSVADGFVVLNGGDMLEIKSAGMIRATPHRVTAPEGYHGERFSTPMFLTLPEDTIMMPWESCIEQMLGEGADSGLTLEGLRAKFPIKATAIQTLLSRLFEMGSFDDDAPPAREFVEELLSLGLLRNPGDRIKGLFSDLFGAGSGAASSTE